MRLTILAIIALCASFCFATGAIAANFAQVQQLLDSKNCPGCDLVGANLSGQDLGGANLVDAKLRGAILSQANLNQANLVGADLTGADVTGTKLRQANLSEAKLSGVDFNRADTHKAKFSPRHLLQDNLQELQVLVTVLGTIVATILIVPQYLENQKWKVYEFIAREFKDFETRQEAINVMRMLDSEDRSIKLFPDAEHSKNKFVIVKKKGLCNALDSLEDQNFDDDIQKPRKADQAYINAAIRDNFDKVLDNLERFNNLIESKIVTQEGLRNYIDSWLEIIHSTADSEIRKKLWLYIEKRKYTGVQQLFARYKCPIYPQHSAQEPSFPPLNFVVRQQLANQEQSSTLESEAD